MQALIASISSALGGALTLRGCVLGSHLKPISASLSAVAGSTDKEIKKLVCGCAALVNCDNKGKAGPDDGRNVAADQVVGIAQALN